MSRLQDYLKRAHADLGATASVPEGSVRIVFEDGTSELVPAGTTVRVFSDGLAFRNREGETVVLMASSSLAGGTKVHHKLTSSDETTVRGPSPASERRYVLVDVLSGRSHFIDPGKDLAVSERWQRYQTAFEQETALQTSRDEFFHVSHFRVANPPAPAEEKLSEPNFPAEIDVTAEVEKAKREEKEWAMKTPTFFPKD